jgi:hypothetical protein
MTRLLRTIAVLLAPFVLTGCLLSPGKFVSSLRIDADRHFTFTYTGEVIDAEPKTDDTTSSSDDKPSPDEVKEKAAKAAADKAEADEKNRTLAATLSKEAGYRKVAYLGGGKFMVDYSVSGTLDHTFVWPFNLDGEVIIPFVAIELRQDGIVRVKAPAFSNDDKSKTAMGGMGGGMPGMPGGGSDSKADGVFTLDTNAEIVSQNNEDGAKSAGGRRTIAWKVTPATKDAPTAVLRMK